MKSIRWYRKFWIWAILVGVVLFLLSSNSRQSPFWNLAEQLIVEVTAPFQKLIQRTINTTQRIWLGYFYLVNLREENLELRGENDALMMENARYREMLATHERLKKLLQFKQTINRPVVAAQVVGRDPSGWFKSVIIDKGIRAGIKLNMPVVNAFGVVGRVVSVSPHYAKVLLIIDQNSAVDCLIQRSRDRGMVKGLSNEVCKLDYVVETSDVLVNDVVVTSGLGGVFPKGLPVGKIIRAKKISGELFKDIEVVPTVDFSKLEEVLVILKEDESSNLHIESR